MKKLILSAAVFVFALSAIPSIGHAQTQPEKATVKKKKKTIDSHIATTADAKADALKKPDNDKEQKAKPKTRGAVYPGYSDIDVSNNTNWYLDIYVDDSYRMTLAPWSTNVTWAIPGNTVLYGKATFTDGSYKYWGPLTEYTGYQYNWNLYY